MEILSSGTVRGRDSEEVKLQGRCLVRHQNELKEEELERHHFLGGSKSLIGDTGQGTEISL